MEPGPGDDRRTRLARQVAAALGPAHPGSGPVTFWFVPGRIEVLGKHTDYAGGRSLVCAIERGLCFGGRAAEEPVLTLTRCDTGDRVRLPLSPGPEVARGEWTGFAAAVAGRLARDFAITRGAELALAGDLPAAAGLSSGTALTIGIFLGLAGANRLDRHPRYQAHLRDPAARAEYLSSVENGRPFGPFEGGGGVGTLGGAQDQAAILLAEPGRLTQLRFRPLQIERTVRFPEDRVFAVATSGVPAEKTAGARERYNRAAQAAGEILRRWQELSGETRTSLGEVLARAPGAAERLSRALEAAPRLRERLIQFAAETEELVPAAGDALEAGDLERFGELAERSAELGDRGLGNQVPETLHLHRSARRLGAAAASPFGAGFGGSVWALVGSAEAAGFLAAWREDYRAAFPHRETGSDFFAARPAGPASGLPEL